MDATQFLEKHNISTEQLKIKTVAHLMNAFALFRVDEYRQAQFKPMRISIIEHIALIVGDNIIGITAAAAMENVHEKSDEEIKMIAYAFHEMAIEASAPMKKSFGSAYTFFKTLNLSVYEYNECICDKAMPNERQWLHHLPEAKQSPGRLAHLDTQSKRNSERAYG